VAPPDLDGWAVAAELTRSAAGIGEPGLRLYAERLAASAVLQRASRLVGPLRGATRTVREPLREPYDGELDIEATLGNVLGKPFALPGDLIVQRREERRHQVVLMIDTSLSMAGEKMALAAVAAAVLALNLRPGDLAVVLFADEARAVARLHEEVAVAELVRRMLATPCGGTTNVAAALALGHAELERGRNPRCSAVLVSDGLYTAGVDPRAAAARFGALHVLLTHEGPLDGARPVAVAGRAPDKAAAGRFGARGVRPSTARGTSRSGVWIAPKRSIGADVARAGGGRLVHVEGFATLPRRVLDLADHVLR
jgi:Mg-chelatase subunit ChlD